MSPEQARGDLDRLGPRSDVYSLGATLYCLLTGRAAFEGDDVGEVLRRVERGDFPAPRRLDPTIDAALEAACLKAMALEPGDRYAVVPKQPGRGPRAVDGRRAGLGLARAAPPPGRRRWARRHRVLVAGLAAALLAAVAALAVGGVLVARQRDRAEQNLAFARTVVDEMYTQVALELEQSERALPEQRLILEKAVRFYQRFAVPQSRDPAVLFEAARAGLRLGKIQRWLSEYRKAERAARYPLPILSRLAADHPADPDYRECPSAGPFRHRRVATIPVARGRGGAGAGHGGGDLRGARRLGRSPGPMVCRSPPGVREIQAAARV